MAAFDFQQLHDLSKRAFQELRSKPTDLDWALDLTHFTVDDVPPLDLLIGEGVQGSVYISDIGAFTHAIKVTTHRDRIVSITKYLKPYVVNKVYPAITEEQYDHILAKVAKEYDDMEVLPIKMTNPIPDLEGKRYSSRKEIDILLPVQHLMFTHYPQKSPRIYSQESCGHEWMVRTYIDEVRACPHVGRYTGLLAHRDGDQVTDYALMPLYNNTVDDWYLSSKRMGADPHDLETICDAVFLQVIKGIEALWNKGVRHGDLHFNNMMIQHIDDSIAFGASHLRYDDGSFVPLFRETGFIRFIDFGLSVVDLPDFNLVSKDGIYLPVVDYPIVDLMKTVYFFSTKSILARKVLTFMARWDIDMVFIDNGPFIVNLAYLHKNEDVLKTWNPTRLIAECKELHSALHPAMDPPMFVDAWDLWPKENQ